MLDLSALTTEARNVSTNELDSMSAIEIVGIMNREDRTVPLAIETAHRFGIKEEDAIKMAKEITETVKDNWEKLAVTYGIPRGKIEDMRPAFSDCYE